MNGHNVIYPLRSNSKVDVGPGRIHNCAGGRWALTSAWPGFQDSATVGTDRGLRSPSYAPQKQKQQKVPRVCPVHPRSRPRVSKEPGTYPRELNIRQDAQPWRAQGRNRPNGFHHYHTYTQFNGRVMLCRRRRGCVDEKSFPVRAAGERRERCATASEA